jgi:hypothetical protein
MARSSHSVEAGAVSAESEKRDGKGHRLAGHRGRRWWVAAASQGGPGWRGGGPWLYGSSEGVPAETYGRCLPNTSRCRAKSSTLGLQNFAFWITSAISSPNI